MTPRGRRWSDRGETDRWWRWAWLAAKELKGSGTHPRGATSEEGSGEPPQRWPVSTVVLAHAKGQTTSTTDSMFVGECSGSRLKLNPF